MELYKKPNSKKVQKATKPSDEKFVYTSMCCGVRANKPSLVNTPEAEGTLGTWHCTKCSKKAAVRRTVKAKEEPKAEEAASVV